MTWTCCPPLGRHPEKKHLIFNIDAVVVYFVTRQNKYYIQLKILSLVWFSISLLSSLEQAMIRINQG